MNKEPNNVINLDFAKVEQRMAEHFGAPKRKTSLLDIHTITAAISKGVLYSQVTVAQRKAAKVINFSLMYSPTARWQVPAEGTLRKIYTDAEWHQLCTDLGVTQPLKLLEAIETYFSPGQRP